jgi:ABC-2 type transport system permease protein
VTLNGILPAWFHQPPSVSRKYSLLVSLAFQDALQYRAEGVIWFLFDLLPPLMMIFVWLTAYRDTDSVAGYSLGAMVGYYLGLVFLRNVVTSHPEWEIALAIRNGKLSTLLVKPIHPWGYWMVYDSAWGILRLLMVAPILLAALLLLGDQVRWPPLTPESVAALSLSLPLAYLLCYLVKLCVGLIGFWLLDINGLAGFTEVASYLLGGTIVPLELLPEPLRLVAGVLPFQYIYHFPLSVLLGRLQGEAIWNGLAIQLAWTLGFLLLARWLWYRGLRRYEAVGL